MWKGFVLGIAVAALVATLFVWIVGRGGFISAAALNARPVPLENWLARTSLRASLIRNAPQGRIPVPNNEDTLIQGVKLFAVNCIVCHGTSTGDAGATPIALGEYPAPPQLASHGVEDDPLGWTFWKIQNGIRWTGMPAWQNKLDDRQIWAITLFLSQMNRLPPAVEQVWHEVRQSTSTNP
jgi:thiosulfate dehydrogenase